MHKNKEQIIKEVRQTAEGYYRRNEFYCSEAVVTAVNDALGRPLPPEIVRLASGFPVGIGMSGCVCGAVIGGCMALGLVYGRTEPGAPEPGMFEAAAALHDYIKDKHGSTCCRVLVKPFLPLTSPEQMDHCVGMTGEVAAWVMQRIVESGLVPKPRD